MSVIIFFSATADTNSREILDGGFAMRNPMMVPLAAAVGLLVLGVAALGLLWTPVQPSTHTISSEQPPPSTKAP